LITEITTMIFFSLAAIGAVMAVKWKKRNLKPRLTDKERQKINSYDSN